MGLSSVTFEGDYLQVIHAVYEKKTKDNNLGIIIFDILYLLNCNPKWFIMYVNREANNWAHNLAKIACNSCIDSFWMEECPKDITQVVQVDKLCSIFI